MLKHKIVSLICKKSAINFILFSSDFKILEFDEDVSYIADDKGSLKITADIRDCFWEFIGNEDNILNLLDQDSVSFKIPMIFKNTQYYDIEIEFIKEDKTFIAYIIKKAKFSNEYLKAIQILNKNTLISQIDEVKNEKNEKHYNLINQNIIRFHVNLDGIILEINSICIYFLGEEESEIIGKHFSNFFHTRESELNNESKMFTAKNYKGEDVLFHADIIPIIKDASITENIIICQDITHVKRVAQELEYTYSHDSLTGIVNRSYLLKKIDNCILSHTTQQTHFDICSINIMHMHEINENFGFHAGDMLLKHVTHILSNVIRSCDTLARVGSHEFIILFEETQSTDNIKSTLDRIRKLPHENPLLYNEDDTIHFEFILGLSSYPSDAQDAITLLSYASKKNHRAHI